MSPCAASSAAFHVRPHVGTTSRKRPALHAAHFCVPDSFTFDSDIVTMEVVNDVLRVTTESGRVYSLYRMPGTPKPATHR